jgi:hypothetical protein
MVCSGINFETSFASEMNKIKSHRRPEGVTATHLEHVIILSRVLYGSLLITSTWDCVIFTKNDVLV